MLPSPAHAASGALWYDFAYHGDGPSSVTPPPTVPCRSRICPPPRPNVYVRPAVSAAVDDIGPSSMEPPDGPTSRLSGPWDVLGLAAVAVAGTWLAYAALAGGDVAVARAALVAVLTALAGVTHRVVARDLATRERLGFALVGCGALAGGALYTVATLQGRPPNPVLGGPASRLFGAVALVSLGCGGVTAGALVVGRVREASESSADRADRIAEEVLDRPSR